MNENNNSGFGLLALHNAFRKRQLVVRTSEHGYPGKDNLQALLDAGYNVVMCHPIGNELEYIVEKFVGCEEEENENP